MDRWDAEGNEFLQEEYKGGNPAKRYAAPRTPVSANKHFYVKTTKTGKNGVPQVYVLGPYEFEHQAQTVADGLDHDYDIIELKTSDLSKATGIIKERMIKTNGFDQATQRIKHK